MYLIANLKINTFLINKQTQITKEGFYYLSHTLSHQLQQKSEVNL